MSVLDPRVPIPLYYQLCEHLKAEILAGRLQVGDRLPAERELAEQNKISRMTVRQALTELDTQGYLTRRPGLGTFVTTPTQSLKLSQRGVTADLEASGMRAGARILACWEEPAAPEVARALHLPPGASAIRLERLRLVNGEPFAYQLIHLSASRFPGLAAMDLNDKSLYAVLQSQYGVSAEGSTRTVESIGADPIMAAHLQVPVGAPLLRIGGVSTDQSGQPLEYGFTAYRPDRYRLTVEFR